MKYLVSFLGSGSIPIYKQNATNSWLTFSPAGRSTFYIFSQHAGKSERYFLETSHSGGGFQAANVAPYVNEFGTFATGSEFSADTSLHVIPAVKGIRVSGDRMSFPLSIVAVTKVGHIASEIFPFMGKIHNNHQSMIYHNAGKKLAREVLCWTNGLSGAWLVDSFDYPPDAGNPTVQSGPIHLGKKSFYIPRANYGVAIRGHAHNGNNPLTYCGLIASAGNFTRDENAVRLSLNQKSSLLNLESEDKEDALDLKTWAKSDEPFFIKSIT